MIRNFLTIFLLLAAIVLPDTIIAQSCATPYHANLEFDAAAFEKFRRSNQAYSRNNKRRMGVTIHVVQGTTIIYPSHTTESCPLVLSKLFTSS